MARLNITEVQTTHGYRSFELYCDDILSVDVEVDAICVSAFPGDYSPTNGSVIGALTAVGIDVSAMALDPLFDFRAAFGAWISQEIHGAGFRHIIVIESSLDDCDSEVLVRNLFSLLSVLEIGRMKLASVAMPLIGAGDQAFSVDKIIAAVVSQSRDFLEHSRYLSRIVFVEKNQEKSIEMDKAMDRLLGRERVKVPSGVIVESVKQEILSHIASLLASGFGGEILNVFRLLIISDSSGSIDLGIQSRKVVEFIVNDIFEKKRYKELSSDIDLYKKINDLSSQGVAPWVVQYMHTLRSLGNEAAHERDKPDRLPLCVDERDLEVCLFCMERVLEFYLSKKTKLSSVA